MILLIHPSVNGLLGQWWSQASILSISILAQPQRTHHTKLGCGIRASSILWNLAPHFSTNHPGMETHVLHNWWVCIVSFYHTSPTNDPATQLFPTENIWHKNLTSNHMYSWQYITFKAQVIKLYVQYGANVGQCREVIFYGNAYCIM